MEKWCNVWEVKLLVRQLQVEINKTTLPTETFITTIYLWRKMALTVGCRRLILLLLFMHNKTTRSSTSPLQIWTRLREFVSITWCPTIQFQAQRRRIRTLWNWDREKIAWVIWLWILCNLMLQSSTTPQTDSESHHPTVTIALRFLIKQTTEGGPSLEDYQPILRITVT